MTELKNIPVSGKLKAGDRVRVHNSTLGGKRFLEGEATLKWKLYPEEFQEFWAVEFDGEEHGCPVYRWIKAEDKI
jgi:hypothetical protein